MTQRSWLRLGAKTIHDVASIGFGGALAACLVINQAFDPASAGFLVARQVHAAIAKYVLVPSMGVVVVSGLVALASTHAYMAAGWAWLKALLGLSVFEATLIVVGSSARQAEIAAAVAAADLATVQARLRSEAFTLWLLIALSIVNVVLAVWRPKFGGARR